MEVGMLFKLEDYLSQDQMREIAEECFANAVRQMVPREADIDRVLTNSAYSLAAKVVEETHHIDLERVLTEKVAKILLDESHLKYVLFRDMREYGDRRLGIALEMLEQVMRNKFQDRIEKLADDILNGVDTKKNAKFEKLVAKEVAAIIASRMGK